MGAFAVAVALHRRERDSERKGEWIDLAWSDTLFRLAEWQIILRDQLGYAPMRSGNQLAVAPAAVVNVYRSADDGWVTVTWGTPRSVSSIARLLGFDTTKYETQQAQVSGTKELDGGLRQWSPSTTQDAWRPWRRQVSSPPGFSTSTTSWPARSSPSASRS